MEREGKIYTDSDVLNFLMFTIYFRTAKKKKKSISVIRKHSDIKAKLPEFWRNCFIIHALNRMSAKCQKKILRYIKTQ